MQVRIPAFLSAGFYFGCIVTGNVVCAGCSTFAPDVSVPVVVNEPACVGVTL